MTQSNKTKTNTYNHLSTCLMDFYQAQTNFHKESIEQLNNFMGLFDQNKLDQTLKKFNLEQKSELDLITEISIKYKSPPRSSGSTPFLNTTNNFSSYIAPDVFYSPSLPAQTSNHNSSSLSVNKMNGKSNDNLYQMNGSQPFIPSLFSISRLKENYSSNNINNSYNNDYRNSNQFNNKSFGLSKTGYLYKKTYHTRMRTWLKRKCQAENGIFYIYHSDVSYIPIR